MSDTELLMKKAEGLPPDALAKVFELIDQLTEDQRSFDRRSFDQRSFAAPPAAPKPDTPEADTKPGRVYPPDMEPWQIGSVNPELLGSVETLGDIIGPFHDEWEKGY
jgi:hypothetical protein